ncbi:uncharacterized protein DSM5745_03744 [Aspergillus mulundensis]|uniref:Trichothecene 3-O-acetyltransferase-like N-terminal domain-containing protein n=1 Tax=Aspergillus mulundensis TaxID=1810919 RepID=A0A3D8SLG5_9EURO|nr:hypothetical protein DSM5745_03744 [Aspergillus mulundensis]RDW87102.1 hypothetical protein DSM5745_03744 [Aspergillus mulundensis]
MSFQDVLGQLPLLKSYTHILLVFSVANSQHESVLESLQCATKRLLSAFPFLAGVVVHKDIHPGRSGTFSVDLPNGAGQVTQALHIKDLSSILPDYVTLHAAKAPPAMLTGALVAPPRPAFPRVYTESTAPVLEIQASLINGGMLLTLAAQHNIIDATGIFYIAHVLAKTRGEDGKYQKEEPHPTPPKLPAIAERNGRLYTEPPDTAKQRDIVRIQMDARALFQRGPKGHPRRGIVYPIGFRSRGLQRLGERCADGMGLAAPFSRPSCAQEE